MTTTSKRVVRHMTLEEARRLQEGDGVLFRTHKVPMRRGYVHKISRKVPKGEMDWLMFLIRYNGRHFLPAIWRQGGWQITTAMLLVDSNTQP